MSDELIDKIHTLFLHGPRKRLGISITAYCIADMIYFLSQNEDGWCYMSKVTMASLLSVTKQTVINIIKRLIDDGLVERHPVDKTRLRTTSRWHESVVKVKESRFGKVKDHPVKKLVEGGKNSLPRSSKDNLPNSNSLIEISNKGFSGEKLFSSLKEKNIILDPLKVKHPSSFVLGFLETFSDRCQEQLKERPVLGEKEYYRVVGIRKHCSEEELEQLLEDWFENGSISYENLPHLGRLIHAPHINRWRSANQ